MQALMYEGPGSVAFREVAEPALGSAAGALVRPTTVATCDLDRVLVEGLPGFDPPFPSATSSSARWWPSGRGSRSTGWATRSPPRTK